jgi:hypothetical protein
MVSRSLGNMVKMGTSYCSSYASLVHHLADERWKVSILKHIPVAITIFLVTSASIMLLDRRPAVAVLSHKFITPSPIFAGDNVRVEWEIVDLRLGLTGQSCGGTVYVIWIDSEGKRHYPSKPFYVPLHEVREGHKQTFVSPRMVPADMPPGESIYTVTVDRDCNPLQRWLWPMRDSLPEVKFTVSAPP